MPEIVATRRAEVLFIQVLRAYIASEPGRNQEWLRAVFDPQISAALTAFHDRVAAPIGFPIRLPRLSCNRLNGNMSLCGK
ncbi:hypothetical protein AB4Y89_03610 [Terriglobus sp. 2YAB30_2]|uniref:hypothetical protein n=1 Tax=Terriglobus sp. 2YAB30_2 TaxID=3233023 RepID=UPI003F99F3CA